jgi:hypothetical protein
MVLLKARIRPLFPRERRALLAATLLATKSEILLHRILEGVISCRSLGL